MCGDIVRVGGVFYDVGFLLCGITTAFPSRAVALSAAWAGMPCYPLF